MMQLQRFAWWVLAAIPVIASAGLEFRQTAEFVLPTEDRLSTAHVILAERADFKGCAADDLFVLAPEVRLSGTFSNDVWAIGNDIRLDGSVSDHLRAIASFITVSGRVDNGIAAVGSAIRLAESSTVRGGCVLLAEDVTLVGQVNGPVQVTAVRCTLAGQIEGDVQVTASDIVVMPGTRIGGHFYYTSPTPLVLDESVQLSGVLKAVDAKPTSTGPQLPWTVKATALLLSFLGSLLSGSVLMMLFPGWTGRSVSILRQSTARCGLAGAVALAIVPMAALLLLFTLVGIPLGLLAAGLLAALLYLGQTIVAVALGGALMRWQGPQPLSRAILALALGLLPVHVLALLPDIGSVFSFILHLTGMGALLLNLWTATSQVPNRPPPLPGTTST